MLRVLLCIGERNISGATLIHSEAEVPHTERLSIVSGKTKSRFFVHKLIAFWFGMQIPNSVQNSGVRY
jgi:hypothetical protein